MPRTRRGPQSREESKINAVFQLSDEPPVCGVVYRVHPEDVAPLTYTHVQVYVLEGRASLFPLHQSVYLYYLTPSSKMMSHQSLSADLKHAPT